MLSAAKHLLICVGQEMLRCAQHDRRGQLSVLHKLLLAASYFPTPSRDTSASVQPLVQRIKDKPLVLEMTEDPTRVAI